MLNAEQDKIISFFQTYFVFVPLFSQPILTRHKLYFYEKLSLEIG